MKGSGRNSVTRRLPICNDVLVEWNLDIGAEQFERLCQALARYVIGPAVRVVGAGPDRGWDAEFEGPVNFPWSASDEKWDGFGILIVKYKSSSIGQADNSKWFRRAVKQELEKLAVSSADTSNSTRLPEYIVFATNVPLSPNVMDSVEDIVAHFATSLNLRGWSIWHRDAISRYIESFPDVRYSFILGHDFIPQNYESVEIGDLCRFELTSLGSRPSGCPEVVSAWWRLISTHDSVGGLFGTLYSVRLSSAYGQDRLNGRDLSDSSQDLLRAAIVFTSAGVDACLEVLLSHAIPTLISRNEKVRGKFDRYIDNLASAPKRSQDFLSAIKDLDPRMRLLELYIRDLTSPSFQGTKSIKDRCLAALGITNEQLPYSRLLALDDLFRSRNAIAHRLDIMQSTTGDVKPDRQPRRQDDVGRMCDQTLMLVRDLVEATAKNLGECRLIDMGDLRKSQANLDSSSPETTVTHAEPDDMHLRCQIVSATASWTYSAIGNCSSQRQCVRLWRCVTAGGLAEPGLAMWIEVDVTFRLQDGMCA
jgi:hypothetical protein